MFLIMFVCLCVIVCVCHQDYCKSNQPISLKLGAVIGPITNGNNRLTFSGDSVRVQIPDQFSTSLSTSE